MAESVSSKGINYPTPIEAPSAPYTNPAASNPVMAGWALQILSEVVVNIGPLQGILWNNANFGALRALEATGVLDAYTPCFDPTVIPHRAPAPPPPSPSARGRSAFLSSENYTAAYAARSTTPAAVTRKLSVLLSPPSAHAACTIFPIAPTSIPTSSSSSSSSTPLAGIPILVKDELAIAGTPKTLGLTSAEAIRRGAATSDAGATSWCVQRLIDAGALVVGKASMHEIGFDTTNNNPNWGTPRNPYNSAYYTGGSSGGSAYAVAAGLVPIAIGADGGGSIRVPAAYCGVFGLKPSHGRVSSSPTLSIAPTTGVAGPIAATVDDLELAYSIMAQPDPDNTASREFPRGLKTPREACTGKRVLGVYKAWIDDCDADVKAATQAAIAWLQESAGYEVVEIELPLLKEGRLAHALTIMTEIGQGFCRGDARGLTPANKVIVAVGTRTSARDFAIAQKVRALMMGHLSYLFGKHGDGLVIVSPVTPHAGAKIHSEDHVRKGGAGVSNSNLSLKTMQYVFLSNFTGCPSISIPCGYSEEALPIGLMGMATWGAEETLLELGRAGERYLEDIVGRRKPGGEAWVDMMSVDVGPGDSKVVD